MLLKILYYCHITIKITFDNIDEDMKAFFSIDIIMRLHFNWIWVILLPLVLEVIMMMIIFTFVHRRKLYNVQTKSFPFLG